jgi:hypothetical protein
MDESLIAKTLYMHDPIIKLVDGFVPAELDPEYWLERVEL